MRKDSVGAELQSATLSIAEALNQAEALIESCRYKEAQERLKATSRTFQISIVSQESFRFHYLCGLLFFRLGKHRTAWEQIEEALQIFKKTNASNLVPENDNLPDFIKEKLRHLHEVEIALLTGLEDANGKMDDSSKENFLDRIAEITNTLENLHPLAKIYYLSGCVRMHLAKLDESLEHLERAATYYKLAKDWAGLARTLNLISHAYHRKGELGLCIQLNGQARVYSQKAGDRYTEMFLRHNLAYFHLTSGDWKPTIPLVSNLLRELERTKDYSKLSSTLLTWGYANLLRNRLRETRKAYAEALRISTEHGLAGMLKLTHVYFAELSLAIGRYADAEKHLKKALEITRQETPGGSTETQAWRDLGDVYVAWGLYEQAKSTYDSCLNCLHKLPDKLEEGAVHRGLGTLYSRQNQSSVSRRQFKKAFDIFERCGNHWEKAKTIVVASESGVFTPAEMEPDIAWAIDVFKRLDHPVWLKRARVLLTKHKNIRQPVALPLARELTERKQIVKALMKSNGNITQAAKKLGLLRQTLQYKVRRYGIEI